MSTTIPKNIQQSSRWARLGGAALASLLTLAGATQTAQAQAQVDCATLPNPLYFPATTLLQSLMSKVGPILADPSKMGAGKNITVVYFPEPSCATYDLNRRASVLEGEATYYTQDGQQSTCRLSASANRRADLTAMDVGGIACVGALSVPTYLKEFPSYVETLGFVVPRDSSQTAITASEAYYVMRYAGKPEKQVQPWLDPEHIHVRSAASSTQLTVAANIGWPGNAFNRALDSNRGSSAVRDKVSAANGTADAEKTLGILNSSKWESRVDSMKVLAFQPFFGCRGAFFPDSTPTARDKINVRDGHYPIWTNLRFVTQVDRNDNITSLNGNAARSRVERFVALMTGIESDPALPVSQFIIETGNIPSCAMYVKRDQDGGPISSFEHPAPCHCAFLAGNGINDPSCVSCTSDATCGDGKCREGFCEAR